MTKRRIDHYRQQLARSIREAGWRRIVNGVALTLVIVTMLPVVWPQTVHAGAGSQGPSNSGTQADNAGVGTVAWTTPANVATQNATNTTASLSSLAVSHYVVATNFGFTVPTGATVNGIKVDLWRSVAATQTKAQVQDNAVRLVKGGTIQTTDRSTTTAWTATNTDEVHGGSADLWGATLAPSDVNATNFGIAVSAQNVKLANPGATLTAQIDWVGVTVYYTVPSTHNQAAYRWYGVSSTGLSPLVTNPSTGADGINGSAVDTTNGYIYTVGYDNSPGHNEWRIDKQSTTSGSSASGFPITEDLSTTAAQATAVALDVTNGYFYVVGYDQTAIAGDEWRTEKRSMSNGAMAANFPISNNISNGSDRPMSVAVDSAAGFIYIVGFDNSPGNAEWQIEKLNSTSGASDPNFPVASHFSTTDDKALSVALDISGGYMYIAGFDQTPGATNDEWKIDKRSMTNGTMAANFPVTEDISTGNDIANSIAVDPSGGFIYIVGYDSGSGHRWRIEKRSTTTGAQQTNFPISESINGTDEANSLAIDTSGGYMYIAGMDSATGNEFRIEKRSLSSGATTSPGFAVSENVSSGNDTATTVALDVSGGNLYVAGYDSSPGNQEWRTEQRSMSNGTLHGTTESTLAALNTAVSGSSIGQGTEFHLRYLDNIGNSQLDASGQSFKLQYAQKNVSCDTSFTNTTSAMYSDVGSSGAFNYYASSVASDGAAITDDGNVTDGSNTRVAQDMVESTTNFTNNQAAIPSGQDGLWDISLTDVSASGTTAYCFRIVKSTGSLLDTYTVIPELTTAPPSFNQDSFRWFADSSSTTAGSTLAAINAIATAPAQGTALRLRLLVGVASAPLSSSGQSFKLQIATAAGPPGSATCTTGLAYSDVSTSGGAFRYYDNPSITDGVAMASSANDPTATTVNTQNYIESNTNFTNGQSSIAVGADGEWDISLVNAAAFANTTYCFRVVTSSGTVLTNYNQLPGITGTSTPITDQMLRGGEWFDGSVSSGDPDQPFYW